MLPKQPWTQRSYQSLARQNPVGENVAKPVFSRTAPDARKTASALKSLIVRRPI
jgi:hypothetical protein